MEAAVIVACGGQGRRMADEAGQGGQVKQFLPLAGKTVLDHTLQCLEDHPRVGPVVLVLPATALAQDSERRFTRAFTKISRVLAGGPSRQASVALGLAALADWSGPVLIHDGVRPCTPPAVFDRVINGVLAWGNAVAAIPVRDTIKRTDENGVVLETLDRRGLWQIQTPQGFTLALLRQAHHQAALSGLEFTDDAALLEALGQAVHLVPGDPANLKLTYPEDLALLEALLLSRQK